MFTVSRLKLSILEPFDRTKGYQDVSGDTVMVMELDHPASRSYVVVLLMSWTLCSGSVVSGQRRIQGAKTMAKALADIRLVSSWRAILTKTGIKREVRGEGISTSPFPYGHG